jgi:hypothetical protein
MKAGIGFNWQIIQVVSGDAKFVYIETIFLTNESPKILVRSKVTITADIEWDRIKYG